MRDCVSGWRAIKRKGDVYLPRLKEQTEPEYQAYKHRAVFFGATARTLKAFVGFVFSKDPNFEFSSELDSFMLDATMSGVTWYDYCKNRVRDAMSVGRSGTLIDWQLLPENRAYACFYAAEDVLNWKTARINGHTMLTLLVLHETKDAVDDGGHLLGDEFQHSTEDRWRVYRLLTQDGVNFYVYFEEYRRAPKRRAEKGGLSKIKRSGRLTTPIGTSDFELVSQDILTRRGIPLTRIPFVFHNALDMLPEVGPAPLEDISRLNISQYMTSADIEHGRHFTGLPTPIAAGFQVAKGEKLYIGSSKAWVSDKPDAKAYYLSFGGEGLKALETAMEEKQKQMASLGARMLESQTQSRGNVEAFETVQIRQSAETSALRDITLACSASLSLVMQWIEYWHGAALQPEDLEHDCYVRLNTDYISNKIDPQLLAQLLAAYQANALSYDEFFYNLRRGEIIRDDTELETERAALANSPIATMAQLMLPDKTPQAAGAAQ